MFNQELSPSRILQDAIKAVPALRFALAVVGIVAAVVMAIGLAKDMRIALFGAMAGIIIMVITVLFARIASAGSRKLPAAEAAIVWFSILAFSSTITLTISSVFFGWPTEELRPILTGYDPRATISGPPPSACIGDGNCPDQNASIYPCGFDPNNLPRYYNGCDAYASQYGISYAPMHMLVSVSKGGTCGAAYYSLTCVRADVANSQESPTVFSPAASPAQTGQP